MLKKYYFVLSPSENLDELLEKASNYYGSKDYTFIGNDAMYYDAIKKVTAPDSVNTNTNINLLFIGTMLIAMSFCDTVYVAKDWESDDICKICHALAFSHGLEIVYES